MEKALKVKSFVPAAMLGLTMIASGFTMTEAVQLGKTQAELQVARGHIEKLQQENDLLVTYANARTQELSEANQQVEELQNSIQLAAKQTSGWHMNTARITAYSPLDDQNGINSDGEGETTSTGMPAGYGVFAVDPRRIPYGSKMIIVYDNGTIEEGIAGDTGDAIKKPGILKVDVFRRTFKEAMRFGDPKATVLWKVATK